MKHVVLLLCLLSALNSPSLSGQSFVPFTPSIDIEKDFLHPPDYAKPRVFWWWLEGYITQEGIEDDLKAMKNNGIAGAIVFDAGSSGYYTGKLTYHNSVVRTQEGAGFMTDEWRALFAYACRVADSLGMEISQNITSGWNDGGPWITPEYTSQKLVWSETAVEGGKHIDMLLPLPSGLLQHKGKPWFRPVTTLALKLASGADQVKPLPGFNIKAVHSIAIPQTAEGLGYDWEAFVRPLPDGLTGCHARPEDVIDVSRHTDGEGRLRWTAPPGHYLIMRFGHTGTGIRVSTHSPGAGGLAIDYLSVEAMDLQFEHTVLPLVNELKKTERRSLRYLHDDSWELGAANWTPQMEKAFAAANGYDIKPYLPVIAGKIIGSHDISERFLYDFRRTIADLICTNHYSRFSQLAHRHGLGIHPEAGGPHPAPIDALKNMGQSDIPMGEFWAKATTHRVEPHRRLYVKQGASAAHIYGKRFMQAEGPTTIGPHWERDPWMLKPTMDRVFCEGLNRFVIHTFTHSPREAGIPGNEYFAGTHFNPNITWWKQSHAFLDWASRNSFMLSQGHFVADVAFYYGDNVPNQTPLKHVDARLGEGYDYDVVNSDVILTRMSVRDGKIFLPDGMSYHVLALPERKAMNLAVLSKIEQLVKAGATVVGPRPETTAGLRSASKAQKQLQQLADRLWGKDEHVTENMYGKGKIVWGKSVRQTLESKGLRPDFTCEACPPNVKGEDGQTLPPAHIDWIHRSAPSADGDMEVYYVANGLERPELLNCSFRITGRQPELWYPETGKTVPMNIYIQNEGSTSVPLYLDPYGSVFVVFRKPASPEAITALHLNGMELFPRPEIYSPQSPPFVCLPEGDLCFTQSGTYTVAGDGKSVEKNIRIPEAQYLDGEWQVSFDPQWGAPALTVFSKLASWTEHADAGIRYYSGSAVYRKTFALDGQQINDSRICLDLGELHNIAEVHVNGQLAGVWWKKPFAGDITHLVKQGENKIEITVVNLWPNRLIGDRLLPEKQRLTKTNVMKFTENSPLLPSGLIGPVRLFFYKSTT
jgi:hypothetical protein